MPLVIVSSENEVGGRDYDQYNENKSCSLRALTGTKVNANMDPALEIEIDKSILVCIMMSCRAILVRH